MNQLIHCISCDQIFVRTPFDQWPEYQLDQNHPTRSIQIIEKDDFKLFLESHSGHQLEDLKILEDSYISEKPYYEPTKISYFKATNGKERFVIKKFREKIDDPLSYQLISGDYSLECMSIEMDHKAITKQIEMEFKERPFSAKKIASFLKLCRHIAEMIEIKDLERAPGESTYPLELYYKMDDLSLMVLLRNCHNIFKGEEYLEMEKFIHRHRDEGVLLLKAIYKIKIGEKIETKKRPVIHPLSFENKKILEKKK